MNQSKEKPQFHIDANGKIKNNIASFLDEIEEIIKKEAGKREFGKVLGD